MRYPSPDRIRHPRPARRRWWTGETAVHTGFGLLIALLVGVAPLAAALIAHYRYGISGYEAEWLGWSLAFIGLLVVVPVGLVIHEHYPLVDFGSGWRVESPRPEKEDAATQILKVMVFKELFK